MIPSHLTVVAAPDQDPVDRPPAPDISVRCHRRLRGPYTGAGTLLRDHVVPELIAQAPELVTPRRIEIIALAPELAPMVPAPPWTLTEHAEGLERTRYYNAGRTRRLAHGITELLIDWARTCRAGGVTIGFLDLDNADATDLELISILLRRCDPEQLTIITEGAVGEDYPEVREALSTYTRPVAGQLAGQSARPPATDLAQADLAQADLAQAYIDSDGTNFDPALYQAYLELPAQERARRHSARADELNASGEPTYYLGAIPYHCERGLDADGAGVTTMYNAMIRCLHLGFYHAAMDLALRGRALTQIGQPKYALFTHKIGACLAYLDRGQEAISYFNEQRRVDTDPEVHMGAAYMLSMLYTRHLPRDDHDEDAALEWANTAIAIADQHPDNNERIFRGAFMRNARALVELHRKNTDGSLALVNEAAAMMDANYGPTEHRLHRSVLRYNRGLVYAGNGEHSEGLAAFDEVIDWDPEYADYYFERAGLRRDAGWTEGAFEDYQRAISLSPPFFEVYVNRADLLRELGDDDAALRDLNYALELEPDLMDALINRADILLVQGEVDQASADIDHGLELEPANPHLLTARAALLAEAGDEEGAWASCTAALAEDPDFAAAWANRAVLAYSRGNAGAAIGDLDNAIRLADSADLRMNRAIALAEVGNHAQALTDLDAALAEGGADDLEILYHRGVSRYATGDIDGARADWDKHLAAYSEAEPSPHSGDIRLREVVLG